MTGKDVVSKIVNTAAAAQTLEQQLIAKMTEKRLYVTSVDPGNIWVVVEGKLLKLTPENLDSLDLGA